MGSAGYYRIEALQQFQLIRRKAQTSEWRARRFNRPTRLLPFSPILQLLPTPNGIERGGKEIPTALIVGSLERAAAFDRSFRPLFDSQRDRWVNMWVLHMQTGWEPILVHQVGNLFFVEDGYHRSSVARFSGLAVIEAFVIEYAVGLQFSLPAILARLDG